jgi:phosphate transport system protein
MQKHFEEELDKLKKRIIKMMNLTENQLNKSFQILQNKQTDSIETIKEDENKIDKIDIKIDLLCQKLFALAQPIASDLRFIMGSLGISNEVERIGDLAYYLSKEHQTESELVNFIEKYDLPILLNKILVLFGQIIESYMNSNSLLAYEIINNCKNLRNSREILNQIVNEMTQNVQVVAIASDLIMVVNKLDRIIGHIENIAESIVFIVDAKIIKHPNLEAKK